MHQVNTGHLFVLQLDAEKDDVKAKTPMNLIFGIYFKYHCCHLGVNTCTCFGTKHKTIS